MNARTVLVTHEGVEYRGQIAEIESTHLGYEDHGIYTWNLGFRGPGWGQGTGHRAVDTPVQKDGKFSHREGCAFGMQSIIDVLQVVGVERWEDLPHKRVIILREDDYGDVKGLANILDEEKVLVFTGRVDAWKEAHGGQIT